MTIVGVIKGDTRSLDNGSFVFNHVHVAFEGGPTDQFQKALTY